MPPKHGRHTINISNRPKRKRPTFDLRRQRAEEDEPAVDEEVADVEDYEEGDEELLDGATEEEEDVEEEIVAPEEIDTDEVKILEYKGDVAEDPEDPEAEEQVEVFVPKAGAQMEEDNVELVPTEGAYKMLHRMTLEWSALSFDVVPDTLGACRDAPPYALYLATATSASGKKNTVSVVKASNLRMTYQEPEDGEGDERMEEDEDYSDPTLASVDNKIPTGVNRVRAMRQRPGVVACWGMDGRVYVYDMGDRLAGLDGGVVMQKDSLRSTLNHRCEGVALDWSGVVPGRLVTGCLNGGIMLWEEGQGRWTGLPEIYAGHKKSVEDLQFSPEEADVFLSCSVDTTLRVWDVRDRKACVRRVKAHATDINVCNWNKRDAMQIISGDDAGVLKVWDFRMFTEPFAVFDWHKQAITSVEWNPHDPTMFAASSEDDTVTLWDISLETDHEAAKELQVDEIEGVPANLLFIHQGQTQIKEVHWHPQIKNVVISTALDGFDIFQPCDFE